MQDYGPVGVAMLVLACLCIISMSWFVYIVRGGRPANVHIVGLGLNIRIEHPERPGAEGRATESVSRTQARRRKE